MVLVDINLSILWNPTILGWFHSETTCTRKGQKNTLEMRLELRAKLQCSPAIPCTIPYLAILCEKTNSTPVEKTSVDLLWISMIFWAWQFLVNQFDLLTSGRHLCSKPGHTCKAPRSSNISQPTKHTAFSKHRSSCSSSNEFKGVAAVRGRLCNCLRWEWKKPNLWCQAVKLQLESVGTQHIWATLSDLPCNPSKSPNSFCQMETWWNILHQPEGHITSTDGLFFTFSVRKPKRMAHWWVPGATPKRWFSARKLVSLLRRCCLARRVAFNDSSFLCAWSQKVRDS